MNPTNACSCNGCQNACKNRPGWFDVGEIEQAAELLGMTTQDFFNKYVSVDWWDGGCFVLAPTLKGQKPADMYPGDPRGECSLFEDGKCKIHEAKPSECAFYLHDTSMGESMKLRAEIQERWRAGQEQIKLLLGREPVAGKFVPKNAMDFLNLMNFGGK